MPGSLLAHWKTAPWGCGMLLSFYMGMSRKYVYSTRVWFSSAAGTPRSQTLRNIPALSRLFNSIRSGQSYLQAQARKARYEAILDNNIWLTSGQLFVTNLNDVHNPTRIGGSVARADDFECLDWNKKAAASQILATGSSAGFVTVWDVREKKERLTLHNLGRKAVSAVVWDPEKVIFEKHIW